MTSCKMHSFLDATKSQKAKCPWCPPDPEMMAWVAEHQRGKSGIYPHRVAESLAAHFQVPLPTANRIVLAHIHEVMMEAAP